jgi:hypothetical protein
MTEEIEYSLAISLSSESNLAAGKQGQRVTGTQNTSANARVRICLAQP